MAAWRETQPLDWVVILFSTVFLLTNLWAWNISESSYDLLGLLGVLLAVSQRLDIEVNKEEAGLFVTVLFFLLVALLSLWVNEMPNSGLRYLKRIADEYLWFAPIFFIFRARQFSEAFIWLMFSLATIVAGIIALHDLGVPGAPDFSQRAAGTTHPNTFGLISLALTCITITGASFFWGRSTFAVIFMAIGTLMGAVAVLFSGSRGTWIATVLLMLITLISYWHRFRQSIRVLAVLTLIVISIVGYQIPIVQQRMQQAIDQTIIYFKGTGDLANKDTSVGGRFEIWTAAWWMFERHSWFGVGPNQYQAAATRYVQSGRWETSINSIEKHTHAHNQLLDALATGGIPGMLAMLLLFGYPVLIFQHRLRCGTSQTSRLSFAGLLAIGAYIFCGLVDATLHFEEQIVIYLFVIAVLFGRVRQIECT
jgi:O-antigen ligase